MPEHISYLQYILGAFIGVGLAAASGFRVFMPLFAVSLASYFRRYSYLNEAGMVAGCNSIATDHLLDTINIPLATIAGTLLFASQSHLGASSAMGTSLNCRGWKTGKM
ncbi:hypothetical protein FQR65_LT19156 [Abscondita terminalis]|nr:hypothetical protein FQR65_LT19156 [Abscondita terminalis]